MPLCVQVIAGAVQAIEPQPSDLSVCAYILQSGAEYLGPFQPLFVVPPAAELGQAFGVGFTLPMVGYLASYSVGLLVNMFKER